MRQLHGSELRMCPVHRNELRRELRLCSVTVAAVEYETIYDENGYSSRALNE